MLQIDKKLKENLNWLYNSYQENWLHTCPKRGQAEMAKKRANLYAKYIPMIAQFCTELAGKKKEPNYKKILEEQLPTENESNVEEEKPIENK